MNISVPLNNLKTKQVVIASPIDQLPHKKLLIFIISALTLGLVFNLSDIDLKVSSLFADGHNGFPLSSYWLTDKILHYYAAKLSALIGLSLLFFNLKQWWVPTQSLKLIVCMRYLLFSLLSALLTIYLLKNNTTLPCAWHITQFGGEYNYIKLPQIFSKLHPIGNCFPSGHAAGGYGLLGLGFIALAYEKPMPYGFIPAAIIGLVYGGAQIMRGAHFISHDFFTISICLAWAWGWAHFFLLPKLNKVNKTNKKS